eukprot:601470-Rhodomonas_salina.3
MRREKRSVAQRRSDGPFQCSVLWKLQISTQQLPQCVTDKNVCALNYPVSIYSLRPVTCEDSLATSSTADFSWKLEAHTGLAKGWFSRHLVVALRVHCVSLDLHFHFRTDFSVGDEVDDSIARGRNRGGGRDRRMRRNMKLTWKSRRTSLEHFGSVFTFQERHQM